MLSVSSWLYVASSVINHGMFYGPVHIPEKQRLKATSTKLKEKWETAKNIRSESVEVQTSHILPQTYSTRKHEGKKKNLYDGFSIPTENIRTDIHFNFLKKFNPNGRVGV